MSNDAAGFATRYGPLSRSPTWAFDAGLRPDPFPDQTASLLPGLLAATRTGLTPAGNDELQTRTQPLDDHLLITGRTGWSTRRPKSGRARSRRLPARIRRGVRLRADRRTAVPGRTALPRLRYGGPPRNRC